MSELIAEQRRILWHFDRQTLVVEPWGKNSLRVRATCLPPIKDECWALLPDPARTPVSITEGPETLSITHGNLKAVLNIKGQLAFYNQHGELLLEEFWRSAPRWALTTAKRIRISTSAR